MVARRETYPFANVLFVNIGAQIILLALLLDDFPTTNFMAQFSLPIKTQNRSIANLRACTQSDNNARLDESFSRQHPLSSRDQNDSETNHHIPLLPAEAPGLASFILFSVLPIQ